jgi:hypothetical protein
MRLTYTNPLYPHTMADPFVLAHEGHYSLTALALPLQMASNHLTLL